jgi:hypothetical protein
MGRPLKTLQQQLDDANQIIRSKNRELIAIRREVNRRSIEQESAEKVRSEIFGLAEYSPEPPKWLTQEPGKSSSGVPLIQLNDWHWGERVYRDQTGGINEFNRRVARQRVHTLFHAVNDLCFHHMTNPDYPGAVVTILGDMITGCIHDDLALTNEGPLTISLVEVENHIIALLKGWAEKFKKLSVICVPGNHGRNTIKPRNNNKIFESYEWLVYCRIEKYFRDDPRVDVYVPNEVDAHFNIFGHRFMATHGDTLGVSGGDGFIGALGPIARGTLKVGAQQREAGRHFDTLIIGHFHIYVPRGDAVPVLVSPCLIGHSMYGHLKLRVRPSEPAQALSFIHPKRGFTAQWPVQVSKKIRGPAKPWFEWTGGHVVQDLGLDA